MTGCLLPSVLLVSFSLNKSNINIKMETRRKNRKISYRFAVIFNSRFVDTMKCIKKVKLSRQGADYLNNPNCSTIVRAVLRSIDSFSAEVLDVDETIIRVRLSDKSHPEVLMDQYDFTIHKDHLELI